MGWGKQITPECDIDGEGLITDRQLIIRVSYQLKAGEFCLIDTTLKEAEAAKGLLNNHRKRCRERHAKKKQSN